MHTPPSPSSFPTCIYGIKIGERTSIRIRNKSVVLEVARTQKLLVPAAKEAVDLADDPYPDAKVKV
jgi:hypothetical protein